MKTIRCPQCNLVNFATISNCKRCNYALLESSEGESQQSVPHLNQPNPAVPPYQSTFQPSYPYSDQNIGVNKKLAVVSMILGIISFPLVNFLIGGVLGAILGSLFGGVGAIIGFALPLLCMPTGLISGLFALMRVKQSPNEFGGKGFAVAGIILSSFAVLVTLIIAGVSAIAVPNIIEAKRSADEYSAIASIRTIAGAEITYQATAGMGNFGDLDELARSNLISKNLANGASNGYVFVVTKVPANSQAPSRFEILAKPISTNGVGSTGGRSFYYSSEDMVLRASNKNGKIADRTDPPVGSDSPPKIASQR